MGGGDTKFVPCTLQQLLSGDGQFYTTNYSTTMSTSFNSNQLPSDFNVLVPKNRPIHIFTEGVFDLFHYGHVRQLRQVKEAFPNVKVTAGGELKGRKLRTPRGNTVGGDANRFLVRFTTQANQDVQSFSSFSQVMA